jgi:hypothetical protein
MRQLELGGSGGILFEVGASKGVGVGGSNIALLGET